MKTVQQADMEAYYSHVAEMQDQYIASVGRSLLPALFVPTKARRELQRKVSRNPRRRWLMLNNPLARKRWEACTAREIFAELETALQGAANGSH